MLRKILIVVALAVPILAAAQDVGSSPPAAVAAEPVMPPTTPGDGAAVFGHLIHDAEAGKSFHGNFCRLESHKTLPAGAIVVVARRVPCKSPYATASTTFLEVFLAGKRWLVKPAGVHMAADDARKLDALELAPSAASVEQWTESSRRITLAQKRRALDAIDRTAKQGLAIVKSEIFDVSEHTEGTGFSVTIYNSGKKTIKYATFSVVGLNAVNDPVRDGMRNTISPTLRGIGPVEPGEVGSWSRDYMWMTDIVQSFRISQIKLEYTDGTSKVLTNAASVSIDADDYALLVSDVD